MTGPATTILTSDTDDSWRDDVACLDVPGDVFFPVRAAGGRNKDAAYDMQVAAAKAICAGCPVRADCLDWAVATGQAFGIWGGLTPEERQDFGSPRSAAA